MDKQNYDNSPKRLIFSNLLSNVAEVDTSAPTFWAELFSFCSQ